MMVVVEDFNTLTMSVLSKACVRFYPTEQYFPGCGVKAKYRFEYNDKFRRLLARRLRSKKDTIILGGTSSDSDTSDSANDDEDPLWNKMSQRVILFMLSLKHTIQ
jgi:hypothetical protein